MGPGMFDGLVTGLLVMGAAIGIAMCGIVWFAIWLFSHVSIHWIA